MGQAIGGIVKCITGRDQIKDDPKKMEEVKDWLMQQNEMNEMKLKQFYSDIVIESTGKGQRPTVPISTVVDKVESSYVYCYEKQQDVLLSTIGEVVDGILEGKWKNSISDLIHGGLQAFFGPSVISTSGETQETRKYHVVWCNNALIRIDIFVTQSSLNHVVGSSCSTNEQFGAYIMVISVVNIEKVQDQVLIYEFSKFINQIKAENAKAIEELKKDIEDEKVVLDLINGLYAGASQLKKRKYSDRSSTPPVLPKEATAQTDNDEASQTNETETNQNNEDDSV